MNEYKVISSGKRTSSLLMNENPVGAITNTNWSSTKAEISLPNGEVFQVAPKGFWERTTEVTQNDMVIVSFRFNWKNGIIMTTPGDSIPQTYRLKRKSLWKSEHQLLDESNEELLLITSVFKWKGFKTEFHFVPSLAFERTSRKELLMLVCIYALHQQQRRNAAVAASS